MQVQKKSTWKKPHGGTLKKSMKVLAGFQSKLNNTKRLRIQALESYQKLYKETEAEYKEIIQKNIKKNSKKVGKKQILIGNYSKMTDYLAEKLKAAQNPKMKVLLSRKMENLNKKILLTKKQIKG